jgi:large subunit ribosomal protein L22
MYKNAEVYSKYKYATIAPKKVKAVIELVRGKDLKEAKVILAFHQSKAAKMILKTLKSAEANAVNNNKLSVNNLYISDAQVSAGPTSKRAHIVARSRVNPILKRTSHIVVGLSQKEAN